MNFFNNIKQNPDTTIVRSSLLSILTLWAFLLFGFIQSASATENVQNSSITKNVSWLSNTSSAAVPQLESITLSTIESSVLISGTSTVHIIAQGHYSDHSTHRLLPNWTYDNKLIKNIDNYGLITVATFKTNTESAITAQDSITGIKSIPLSLKFESKALSDLKFQTTKAGKNTSSCSVSFDKKSTVCYIVMDAYFNDGSFVKGFTGYTGDIKKIVSKTKSTPESTYTVVLNSSTGNRNIELDFPIRIESLAADVNYMGLERSTILQAQ